MRITTSPIAHSGTATPAGTGELPTPRTGSRWRWTTSRRLLVGGSVLAAVCSLGSVAAGAATTSSTTSSPAGTPAGAPPANLPKPTAAGTITALNGDDITLKTRSGSSETVVYSDSTTFANRSGSTTSASLKVGEFVAAFGTTNADGSVSATRIMVGPPPGGGRGPAGHKPGSKPPAGRPPAPPSSSGG